MICLKVSLKSAALFIWVIMLGILCGLAMNLSFLRPQLMTRAQHYYDQKIVNTKARNQHLEKRIQKQKQRNRKLEVSVKKLKDKKAQKQAQTKNTSSDNKKSSSDEFIEVGE